MLERSKINIRVKIITLLVLFLVNSLSVNVYAGLEKLISTLGPKGSMVNVTQTRVIKEKEAGHIMGGSASVSTPPLEDAHLLRAEAPSCNWGGGPCEQGGDIFAGGLSVITADEFTTFLKSLTQHAKAYASILAIKTVCPHCEDIMTWLQEQAAFFNKFTIDGCETMKLMAGGMQTAADSAGKYLRESVLLNNAETKDLAATQRKASQNSDNSEAGLPKGSESILGDNWNLVWKALSTRASDEKAKKDIQFKEFMMSLTGTIISKKVGGKMIPSRKKSLVDKDKLQEYMGIKEKTKKTTLYKCDTADKCLNPYEVTPELNKETTIKNKIDKLISSMMKKILLDGSKDFNSDELVLDQMSSIDIIAIMEQNLTEYGYKNKGDQESTNYEFYINESISKAICYDVVAEYLSKLVDETRRAVAEMEPQQIADYGKIFDKFEQECRELIEMLRSEKINATRIANNSLRLNENLEHGKNRQLKRGYKGLK
ncbi:MAG: hypothetical protein GY694_09385, partial [Gammaproteobacteria bacterium]|nr:hypothetical protein [Gammaproteobacteria bacterium]